MNIAAVIIALITLITGVALGWALARSRESAAAGSQLAALATATAERDAATTARDHLTAEREVMLGALRDADAQVAAATAKLEALAEHEAQLKDSFARMSSEALARSSSQFLELADTRLRQVGGPINETLAKVEGQLRDIEKSRAGAQEALKEQITFVRTTGEALRSETAALVSALRKPQARGRWGELQLRRCLDLAGMTARCDFYEQETVSTSDGVLRPDVLVRLSADKTIVIDSKVTLAAYLEAYDATDDTIRDERLAAHSRHLRKHVNDLAAKAYWTQFSPSPEFVVLFVPGDVFLAAALDIDPGLLDYAFEKRVHIATPTTLISSLRTIAYTWQQEKLADNAQQVFDLGKELYRRLGTFGGHMDKLGRSLTSAVKTYNDSVGSLERNVMSAARKLNDAEFSTAAPPDLAPIEEPVRMLAVSELIDGAERARPVASLPAAESAEPDTLPGLTGRVGDYGIDGVSRTDRDRRTG